MFHGNTVTGTNCFLHLWQLGGDNLWYGGRSELNQHNLLITSYIISVQFARYDGLNEEVLSRYLSEADLTTSHTSSKFRGLSIFHTSCTHHFGANREIFSSERDQQTWLSQNLAKEHIFCSSLRPKCVTDAKEAPLACLECHSSDWFAQETGRVRASKPQPTPYCSHLNHYLQLLFFLFLA